MNHRGHREKITMVKSKISNNKRRTDKKADMIKARFEKKRFFSLRSLCPLWLKFLTP